MVSNLLAWRSTLATMKTTRSSRFGALAVGFALVAAACSTEQAAPIPTLQLTTTTTVITTTTSEPATTTTEATTTTTQDPAIAEIAAAVTGYRRVQNEVFLNPDAPIEPFAEYATVERVDFFASYMQKSNAEGRTYDGSYRATPPLEILIENDTASVLECGIDAGNVYSADGEILFPASDTWFLARYSLVIVDGRWKVTKIRPDGGEWTACEP